MASGPVKKAKSPGKSGATSAGRAGAGGAAEATQDVSVKANGRPKRASMSAKDTAMVNGHSAKPANRKRRSEDDTIPEDDTTQSRAKKARVIKPAVSKGTTKQRVSDVGPTSISKPATVAAPKLNERLKQRLEVFVFGEGSNSELGLGNAKNAIDVKRPRLNALLAVEKVGVVALACGGMHTLALTHDGRVFSWGVNDNGALGRKTTWEGGLRDVDGDEKSDDSDDDDDDSGLNPYESTPAPIADFPVGTNIVKVAAGDSISLALTDDGHVFGWGTFRNQSGILGFYQEAHAGMSRRATLAAAGVGPIETQWTPHLYSELAKIVDIACGNNHCMALTSTGQIYIWGCGEQNQLGHHINERLDVEGKACLVPSLLRTGRRKYKSIYTGADHAFAIDMNDQVWSWGLNSFGATGVAEGAGEDRAAVFVPSLVSSLNDPTDPTTFICGGQHHTIALTQKGKALIFGRLDGLQTGLDIPKIPTESIIFDDNDPPRARILIKPTPIPDVGEKVVHASAGVDHSIIVNDQGKAFSWGISVNYQTGLGTTEDVARPTMIDNTAVREKRLSWCGCGGQYSMLAANSPATTTAAAAASTADAPP